MGISLKEAQSTLFAKMSELSGTLQFYCLDHWAKYTALNIVEIHQEITPLIRYLPNAKSFLNRLQENQKQVILVTNAHRKSLYIKNNLNIVLINSARSASHFRLYPWGFLREGLQSLKRAHIVVFSKTSQPLNSTLNT